MLNLLNKLLEVDSAASEKDDRSRKRVTMLGRLPQYFPKKKVSIHLGGDLEMVTKRANKFLAHQEKRIAFAIQEGNYNKAVFL